MTNREGRSSQPYLHARTEARRLTKRLTAGLALMVVALVALAIVGNTFVRGLAVGPLALLIAAVVGWAVLVRRKARSGVRPALEPPVLPTGPWDYDMAAHGLDGSRISFSTFAGGVLVLNFWVPWHGASMRQMPSLQRLREATADLDVHFACVARDSDSAVREFLDVHEAKPSLPLYVLDGELPDRFGGQIMPATFILDRRGTIALKQVGPAAWDHESVVAFVRGLAAG